MKNRERWIALLALIFSIGFNLFLYRAEPTSQVDPNDNAFQYGLVDRTNQIWDWAEIECQRIENRNSVFRIPYSVFCTLSYLTDHWVPNWAEGYNLPYYYSHVPQIAIVGSWRALQFIPKIPIFKSQFSKNVSNIENLNLFENLKLKIENLSLFVYYHLIIYLLLCFFPLSMFLAFRILKQPWLTAGIAALLASHISTDGLYGMDPPSFLWRGWGLSSQLFAMIFMPIALAYIMRYLSEIKNSKHEFRSTKQFQNSKRINSKPFSYLIFTISNFFRISDFGFRISSLLWAILFITLTTMGHLGLGLMLFFCIPVVAITKPLLSFLNQTSIQQIVEELKEAVIKTVLLALPPIILLSYWIIPTILDSAYHNVSFWDPVWKFNSYGAKEVLVNLWSGFLFDWGRLPVFTLFVLIGGFAIAIGKNHIEDEGSVARQGIPIERPQQCDLQSLPFLFLFFLLMYFGKTTWGNVLDFIPSMNEFHQHRFIVGLHLIGLFLAPIGIMWVMDFFVQIIRSMIYDIRFMKNDSNNHTSYFVLHTSKLAITIICLAIFVPSIYKQTITYATYNAVLIDQANNNFEKQKADADLLIATLKELLKQNPGRVYAGRGGTWGKDFRIAETPYFMHLSTYGIPTVLWLPETWSNNSDTEQYFSEDVPEHYYLYNIRYVVAPIAQKPQPFWDLVKETPSWKLYEVQNDSRNRVAPAADSGNLNTGYIAAGVSPSIVSSDKLSFGNVVRLWIQSKYPSQNIFPELRLSANQQITINNQQSTTFPHFAMTDEASYVTPDGKTHSLFSEIPVYTSPLDENSKIQMTNSKQISNFKFQISNYIQVLSQSSDSDMVFRATVQILSPSSPSSVINSPPSVSCPTCVIVLKQTYHPNWKVTVRKHSDTPTSPADLSAVALAKEDPPISPSNYTPINVFPSYVAVRLEEPGTYEVVFSYQPSTLKTVLLTVGILMSIAGITLLFFHKINSKKDS